MYIECPHCKEISEMTSKRYYTRYKTYTFRCQNINCKKMFRAFKDDKDKFTALLMDCKYI